MEATIPSPPARAGEDPFETPAIVGRGKQVAAIERAITREGPAALVLRGERGVGKSTLLDMAAVRFRARGGHAGAAVGVGPQTTVHGFSSAVRSAYGLAASPELPRVEPPRPLPLRDPEGAPRLLADQPLIAALVAAYERVLLRVDEYDPTPEFAEWFGERFLPHALAGDAAIMVVVAAHPKADPIKAAPTVDVPPLRREDVAAHFSRIGNLLDPPAEAPEVNAWVDAAVEDPECIDRLTRTLSLVRSPAKSA